MRSLFGSLHAASTFSAPSGRLPGHAARGGGVFWSLLCALAGGLQAAALAWPLQAWVPPGLALGQPSGLLQIGSLALLVLALRQAHGGWQAVWRGWVFATAWLSGTFWWLFVSLHVYGGLPAVLAVLAVLALAGALALYYALAAGCFVRWAPRTLLPQSLLFAALWTLAELLRGRWFTGFPWGAGGYAQVDLMAAWAPWVGVYGMGAIAALLASSLAGLVPLPAAGQWAAAGSLPRARGWRPWTAALPAGLLAALWLSVWAGGWWRDAGQRDTASAGPLRVWLLQGNVPQDQKFEPGTGLALALHWYPQQIGHAVQAAVRGDANAPQLVVAPETAIPLLPQQAGTPFWQHLLGVLAQPPADPQPRWRAGDSRLRAGRLRRRRRGHPDPQRRAPGGVCRVARRRPRRLVGVARHRLHR